VSTAPTSGAPQHDRDAHDPAVRTDAEERRRHLERAAALERESIVGRGLPHLRAVHLPQPREQATAQRDRTPRARKRGAPVVEVDRRVETVREGSTDEGREQRHEAKQQCRDDPGRPGVRWLPPPQLVLRAQPEERIETQRLLELAGEEECGHVVADAERGVVLIARVPGEVVGLQLRDGGNRGLRMHEGDRRREATLCRRAVDDRRGRLHQLEHLGDERAAVAHPARAARAQREVRPAERCEARAIRTPIQSAQANGRK
jgi:hypothetical protein